MDIKFTIWTLFFLLAVCFSSQALAAPEMKSHHKNNSLSCEDCHTMSPAEAVSMDQCLLCHELADGKDDYHGAPDKHDSPHYGPELECENCHHEHSPSENFCADCHNFEFNVP